MLTIDALRVFGADTEDGLRRCMGNEGFYLKLVGKVLEDKSFEALADAIARKDLKSAFEAAHSLKGVLGNLSITPIYKPVNDLTELLRSGADIDYTPLLNEIAEKKAALEQLL